jgi:hypothetical protein
MCPEFRVGEKTCKCRLRSYGQGHVSGWQHLDPAAHRRRQAAKPSDFGSMLGAQPGCRFAHPGYAYLLAFRGF